MCVLFMAMACYNYVSIIDHFDYYYDVIDAESDALIRNNFMTCYLFTSQLHKIHAVTSTLTRTVSLNQFCSLYVQVIPSFFSLDTHVLGSWLV